MLVRRAAMAAALIGAVALSLAGCTSSGDTFTPPTQSATPHSSAAHRSVSPGGAARASRATAAARRHQKLCAGLVDAGTKFLAAEGAFSTSTAKQNQLAVQTIAQELQSVEGLSPRRLKSPMRDMITGFHTFASALTHPTAQSRTQLAALARRLAADAKQVSGYVKAHCPAG